MYLKAYMYNKSMHLFTILVNKQVSPERGTDIQPVPFLKYTVSANIPEHKRGLMKVSEAEQMI